MVQLSSVAESPVMTTGEVAELFRVDSKTVVRWARAGKLLSFRTPGGHRRFLRKDVEALIRGQRGT